MTEIGMTVRFIAFYFSLCIIVGTIGNAILIITTIKSKILRSTCHYIIVFLCIADTAHVMGHLTIVDYAVRGTLMKESTCFYMMILPMLGAFFCAPLLFVLAVDRLYAVAFPHKYHLRNHGLYLFILMTFPCSVAILELYVAYTNQSDEVMPCNITTSVGDAFRFFGKITFVLYPMIGLVYLGVVLLLRKKGAGPRFRAVFKSITVSIILLFCCWFFSIILVNIAYLIRISPELHEILLLYGGVAMNTAIASNFFVFYYFSIDYRHEINRVFSFGHKSSKTAPTRPT